MLPPDDLIRTGTLSLKFKYPLRYLLPELDILPLEQPSPAEYRARSGASPEPPTGGSDILTPKIYASARNSSCSG